MLLPLCGVSLHLQAEGNIAQHRLVLVCALPERGQSSVMVTINMLFKNNVSVEIKILKQSCFT
jgi:hypothetical protein